MTQKDYRTLASALATSRPPTASPDYPGWTQAYQAIADALAAENPRFNRTLFANASLRTAS